MGWHVFAIEYICCKEYKTTLHDIQQIIAMLHHYQRSNNYNRDEKVVRYYETHICWLESSIFYNMLDWHTIEIKSDLTPYYISKYDFSIHTTFADIDSNDNRIKKIIFNSSNNNNRVTTKRCPYLFKGLKCPAMNETKMDLMGSKYVSKDKRERIIDHLTNFDHFDAFNKHKRECKDGEACLHLHNLVNNDDDDSIGSDLDSYQLFQSKRHGHLYHHKSASRQIHPRIFDDEEKIPALVCASMDEMDDEKYLCTLSGDVAEVPNKLSMIELVCEVIDNGFERDLLPNTNHSDNQFSFKEFMTQFEICVAFGNKNNYKTTLMNNNLNIGYIFDVLKENYNIFEKLDVKMKHKRHKRIGYPLQECEILSLLLYCNGDCDYDLCQSQRNGTVGDKWFIFDWILNFTIWHLNRFEIHNENIYTGFFGVILDIKKLYLKRDSQVLMFKTNVTFTRDLDVAKQFRGSNGMIIGINMKTNENFLFPKDYKLCCCDVSWISNHPIEKEVLIKKGSVVQVAPHMIKYESEKENQWVICGSGAYWDAIGSSFETMFCL